MVLQTALRTYTLATRKNAAPGKPNEDYALVDVMRGVVIVCDGVTRMAPADAYPNPSPAAEAAARFASAAYSDLVRGSGTARERIRSAYAVGNAAVAAYNAVAFPDPGFWQDHGCTVALIALFEAEQLTFGAIGDCCGWIIREQAPVSFLTPQTSRAGQYHAVGATWEERVLDSRRALRNTGHPFGYGAITGEPRALDYVEYGTLPLAGIPRVILASDGIEALAHPDAAPEDRTLLVHGTPSDIIAAMERLEAAHNLRSDDKTLVVVTP